MWTRSVGYGMDTSTRRKQSQPRLRRERFIEQGMNEINGKCTVLIEHYGNSCQMLHRKRVEMKLRSGAARIWDSASKLWHETLLLCDMIAQINIRIHGFSWIENEAHLIRKEEEEFNHVWLIAPNPLIWKINLTKHVDDMPRPVDGSPVWIIDAPIFRDDCFVINEVVLICVAWKLHQWVVIMRFTIYCNKCLVCGFFENFPLKGTKKKEISLNLLLNTFSLNTLHDVRAVVATTRNCIFLSGKLLRSIFIYIVSSWWCFY